MLFNCHEMAHGSGEICQRDHRKMKLEKQIVQKKNELAIKKVGGK